MRMSDPARAYGTQFTVLDAARQDLSAYLAEVQRQVLDALAADAAAVSPAVSTSFRHRPGSNAYWSAFYSLVPLANKGPFRAGSEDIYCGYGDAFASEPPTNGLRVWICNELPKALAVKLRAIDPQVLADGLAASPSFGLRPNLKVLTFAERELDLHLDSAAVDARQVGDALCENMRAIEAFAMAVVARFP